MADVQGRGDHSITITGHSRPERRRRCRQRPERPRRPVTAIVFGCCRTSGTVFSRPPLTRSRRRPEGPPREERRRRRGGGRWSCAGVLVTAQEQVDGQGRPRPRATLVRTSCMASYTWLTYWTRQPARPTHTQHAPKLVYLIPTPHIEDRPYQELRCQRYAFLCIV